MLGSVGDNEQPRQVRESLGDSCRGCPDSRGAAPDKRVRPCSGSVLKWDINTGERTSFLSMQSGRRIARLGQNPARAILRKLGSIVS